MEIWKKTPYSDKIEVSNYGNVRRIFKSGTSYYKGSVNHDGYLRIKLSINGKTFNKFAHVLVAETFLDNPNNYSQINHINGDKLDNHVDNLEWCSASHNMQHAYDNKLKRTDKRHSRAKLTESEVLDIYNSELSVLKLVEKYSIDRTVVFKIRNGKSWGWLTKHGQDETSS